MRADPRSYVMFALLCGLVAALYALLRSRREAAGLRAALTVANAAREGTADAPHAARSRPRYLH